MKSFCALILIALSVSVECRIRWSQLKQGPYDVGKLLDEFLIDVNEHIRNKNWDAYKLEDFSIANANGKGVILSQMDTLVRTGPATLSNQGTVLLANVTLGLKECYVNVGMLSYEGQKGPVIFKIEDNSVQIAYSIDLVNKTNCTLEWNIFQLLEFSNVLTSSPNPLFNNSNVTDLFKFTIMPELNNHFASKSFLHYLNTNVNPCLKENDLDMPFAQITRNIYYK